MNTQNPTIYVRVRMHMERRTGAPPLVKVYTLQAHGGDQAWVDQMVSEEADDVLDLVLSLRKENGPKGVSFNEKSRG